MKIKVFNSVMVAPPAFVSCPLFQLAVAAHFSISAQLAAPKTTDNCQLTTDNALARLAFVRFVAGEFLLPERSRAEQAAHAH
jgi:hypothetical protein